MHENRYSSVDRALHHLAFSTWSAQAGLADIEDAIFKQQLNATDLDKPVFITALPRAGTTLLLELLVNTGEFASHSYRHMPFLLCPLLWDNFSKRFRKSSEPRERAHGDGMLVSPDSAEAFEEVIWHLFWKKYYAGDYIEPFGLPADPEFERFLRAHFRKIVLLGSDGNSGTPKRYISKNNLNICRLAYLRKIFPDATVIVPFRDPYQHAASLLEQHRNFLGIHREDHFARRYMRAIGHYDFGENLKPVNFGGWARQEDTDSATDIQYWLKYWLACYRHILQNAGNSIHLFSFDALCENAPQGLQFLGESLGLDDIDALVSQGQRISKPQAQVVATDGIDREIMEDVDCVYEELLLNASFQ